MCVCICVFCCLRFLVFFCSFFLQYFDTVGWVFWPVKPSPIWPILCWRGRKTILNPTQLAVSTRWIFQSPVIRRRRISSSVHRVRRGRGCYRIAGTLCYWEFLSSMLARLNNWSKAHDTRSRIIIIIIITSLINAWQTAGWYIQRHHTGMRGAGVAPVGCQPEGPACRQPTANTVPVVHLSQPMLVPTLLLGGQGYMCVNNLPKVVTRYASVGDRTRDLPIASREL